VASGTKFTKLISLTVPDVKSFLKQLHGVKVKLTAKACHVLYKNDPIQRKMLRATPNFYATVAMATENSAETSFALTNHWAWKAGAKCSEDYITSMFVPAQYTDALVLKLKELVIC
jgi:hypothetical protein